MSESKQELDAEVDDVTETQKSKEGSREAPAVEEQQTSETTDKAEMQPRFDACMQNSIIAHKENYLLYFSLSESTADSDNENASSEQDQKSAHAAEEGLLHDTVGVGAKEEGTIDPEKLEDEATKTSSTADEGVEDEDTKESGEGGEIGGEGETDSQDEVAGHGEKETSEAVGDKAENGDDSHGGQETNEAGREKDEAKEEGDSHEQDSAPPDNLPSAEPPAPSVEGEGKKETDIVAKEEVREEKGQKVNEEEEEEEEMVFDYDYEQMKSTPEMVNVAISDMLTLLYPLTHSKLHQE